jgi:hypothetical protein
MLFMALQPMNPPNMALSNHVSKILQKTLFVKKNSHKKFFPYNEVIFAWKKARKVYVYNACMTMFN